MFLHYANFLVRCGHHVTLVTNVLETVFNIDKDLEIKRIPWPGKLGSLMYALLTRFVADLVVADIIVMALVLSFRNRKLVYFAQDFDESYYEFWLQRYFIRFVYYWGLGCKKIPVISVSDALAAELNKFHPPPIEVIKNGVDRNVFYPDPDTGYLPEKGTKKSMLILARYDARKGLNAAIACIAQLRKTMDEQLQIWVVGERVKESTLGGDVLNWGVVQSDVLRKLFSNADVFLYPTIHEGLPLMPLEAMACGCPTVLTTASNAIAKHEFNSWLVKIDDVADMTQGVGHIIANKLLRKRIIKGGLETAKRYSLDRASQEFERHLHKLCS